MITKIILHNFKGFTGEINLTARELNTGNHASGKTRIAQAIEFCYTGCIAEFASSTSDHLFKLCNIQDAEQKPHVGVTCETIINGKFFSFTRDVYKKITKKNDGSRPISYPTELSCHPVIDEKKGRNEDFKIRLAKELNIKDIMFSLNHFTGLKAAGKKKFMLEKSGFDYAAWTKQTVKKYFEENMLSSELFKNDEKMYNDYESAIDELLENFKDNLSLEENCTSLGTIAKNNESDWRLEEKNAIAATEKLTQVKNDTEETTRGLEKAKEQLGTEEKFLNDLGIRRNQNINNISYNSDLTSSITITKDKLEKALAEENKLDKGAIEENIKMYTTVMPVKEEVKHVDGYDSWVANKEELSKALVAHETNLETLNKKIEEWGKTVVRIDNENGEFDDQFKAKEDEIKVVVKNIEKLKSGKCPLMEDVKCTTDFAPMIKFLDEDILTLKAECIQIEKAKLKHKEKDYDVVVKVLEGFKADYVKLLEDIKPSEEEYKLLSEKINDENSSYQISSEEDQLNHNSLMTEWKENQELLEGAKQFLNTFNNFESVKTEKVKGIKDTIDSYEDIKAKPVEETADIDVLITATEDTIAELKVTIAGKEDALRNLKNQQSSIVDVKKAENWVKAYGLLKKCTGLEGILGIVLKQGLDPIRDTITDNLNRLGKAWMFYFDTSGTGNKATFDYGVMEANSDIKKSTDTMSRGENLILNTALMIAFVGCIPDLKYKILIADNLNDLDADMLKLYLNGLSTFDYDNIIVSGIITDRIGTWEKSHDGNKFYVIPDEVERFKVNSL